MQTLVKNGLARRLFMLAVLVGCLVFLVAGRPAPTARAAVRDCETERQFCKLHCVGVEYELECNMGCSDAYFACVLYND